MELVSYLYFNPSTRAYLKIIFRLNSRTKQNLNCCMDVHFNPRMRWPIYLALVQVIFGSGAYNVLYLIGIYGQFSFGMPSKNTYIKHDVKVCYLHLDDNIWWLEVE